MPLVRFPVAETIRQQIGGLALMTQGARGFMADENSLYFDCKPLHRIVRVVVTLDPSDTYTVKVINRKSHEVIWEQDGVYNDVLSELIRNLDRTLESENKK